MIVWSANECLYDKQSGFKQVLTQLGNAYLNIHKACHEIDEYQHL